MVSREELPLIDRVPYELWDAILKFACTRPVHGNCALPPPPSTREPRLAIDFTSLRVSQVCETWRTIALSNPSFWNGISLELPQYPHVNLVSLYIERAGTLPLDVTLNFKRLDMSSGHEVHRFFRINLFESARVKRWRTLKLGLNLQASDVVVWGVFHNQIFTMPLLESVELYVIPRDHTPPNALLPSRLWAMAPVLTELLVTIGSINNRNRENDPLDDIFPRWPILNGVPYDQLTHLILDGGESAKLKWGSIHDIFSVSPKLVSCFLAGIVEEGAALQAGSTVWLSQTIQYLHLEASKKIPDDLAIGLAYGLRAPSLKTLSLVTTSADWEPQALYDFIQESECQALTELRVDIPKATEMHQLENFIDTLKLVPTLQVLHFSSEQSASVTPEFAARIKEWDTDANNFAVCPNLQQLSFGGKTCATIDDDIIDILKTRLCPPNTQRPVAFTTLAINSKTHRRITNHQGIQALLRDPYGLRIIDNDIALEKSTFHNLHSKRN